ncbi:MAG: hypothetical protein BWX76_00116 [Candidatus Cloacimonetes bacterium ADurb.Bin089]|nr:MAG: hypothetical protein BWX76_00116 [Candidatus Cloacimonetes bacterium ADurb.Bin089]
MGWQTLSLPIMSKSFEKKVCLTAFAESEERHLVVQWKPGFFRYRLPIGNEIKRKRWVDEDVNLPTL